KKKVPDQPKAEQIEIDLSYAFEEQKPKTPQSLGYDQATGAFYVSEEKNPVVNDSVDNSVESVENNEGLSEETGEYPEKQRETVDKPGDTVDNFVEKSVDKSADELSTVGNFLEQEVPGQDVAETVHEEELALHPEFDLGKKDRGLEQAIQKLETEKATQ